MSRIKLLSEQDLKQAIIYKSDNGTEIKCFLHINIDSEKYALQDEYNNEIKTSIEMALGYQDITIRNFIRQKVEHPLFPEDE